MQHRLGLNSFVLVIDHPWIAHFLKKKKDYNIMYLRCVELCPSRVQLVDELEGEYRNEGSSDVYTDSNTQSIVGQEWIGNCAWKGS